MQDNNSSEFYYNNGVIEYEEGQYELSIENFKKAIEIDDTIFNYFYNLGVAYIKIEEYDLAIESFNKGIALNARDVDLYMNLGLAFYNKGDFQKAAKAYNKTVSLNSTDPENFNNAGIAYCSLKNYKEAIYNFKHAVGREPKNTNYNYNLAYAYFEAEKYDLAEDCLVTVLNYNRQVEEAHFLFGKIHLKNYDAELAQKSFEKTLEINPDHEEAKIALEEIKLKKSRKSRNIPEEIPEENPEKYQEEYQKKEDLKAEIKIDADNYYNSGVKLLEDKEYDAAIVQLKKTLALISYYPQAAQHIELATKLLAETQDLFNKSLNHFAKSEYSQAIIALEKGLTISPNHGTMKELLNIAIAKNKEQSQSYLESGRYDLAIESLKTTLSQNPNDSKTLCTLGNAYLEQEEYDLALDSFRDTLHVDPNNESAKEAVYTVINELNTCPEEIEKCFMLSDFYIQNKDYAKAFTAITKVFEIDPNNSEAKVKLVKITELINLSREI